MRTSYQIPFLSVRTVAVLACLLIGCTAQNDGPPEIRVDKTACERCRMLVSDGRYAAAVHADRYLIFDDIGCMLDYRRTHAAKTEQSVWVRDFRQNVWVDASECVFYLQDDRISPMGYGYIALRRDTVQQGTAIPKTKLIGSFRDLKANFDSR